MDLSTSTRRWLSQYSVKKLGLRLHDYLLSSCALDVRSLFTMCMVAASCMYQPSAASPKARVFSIQTKHGLQHVAAAQSDLDAYLDSTEDVRKMYWKRFKALCLSVMTPAELQVYMSLHSLRSMVFTPTYFACYGCVYMCIVRADAWCSNSRRRAGARAKRA